MIYYHGTPDSFRKFDLSKLDNGIVYWENPVLFLTKDTECNIEYKGKHYNKYSDFLSKVMG